MTVETDAAVIAWVAEFYNLPGCDVGGPLHVVVDDYNVEDEPIIWVLQNALDEHWSYDHMTPTEKVHAQTLVMLICAALLSIEDEDHRIRLCALGSNEGYRRQGIGVSYPMEAVR